MARSYSEDLRKRVLAHYELYGSGLKTSKEFQVSRSVIYQWKARKEETGEVKARSGYQKGYGHKIKDEKKFLKLVEENAGLTLKELVKKSKIKMSIMTCSRALKKLKVTRKKRVMDTKNEMKVKGRDI
jgi:Transposase and inactivated derivatives